jgi:rhodanese-related sulfurtransferase
MCAMTVSHIAPSYLVLCSSSSLIAVYLDYIGGHIKNSLNFPSRSLDATMPTLVRKLEDKDVVVFHCALSQERGPRAALKYLRETQEQQARPKPDSSASEEAAGKRPADELAQQPDTRKQTVYVLDRGFNGWQRTYGKDADLTEGYRPEIWENE